MTRPPEERLERALELAPGASPAWLMGRRTNDPDAPQQVLDPTAGTTLTTFDAATPADVTAAVPEIAAAGQTWAALGWTGRMRHLKQFWAEVEAHAEDLAILDTYDAGLPIATSRADLTQSLGAMDALVGWSLEVAGRTYPPPTELMTAMTLRQPYGVVAAIVPYNHPAKFALVNTLPALLAGNVVLLKPSDQTPLSAMLLGDIASRTLPPGRGTGDSPRTGRPRTATAGCLQRRTRRPPRRNSPGRGPARRAGRFHREHERGYPGAWKMSDYGAGSSSEEVLDWTRGKSIIFNLS